MADPVMCVTIGHENLPADYLGVYDDGDGAEADVAYCDACALEVAQSYRPTKNLRVPTQQQLNKIRTQLEALATEVSDGAFHVQPFDNERLADRLREVARG